jgi:PAS domain S-box-containing protein
MKIAKYWKQRHVIALILFILLSSAILLFESLFFIKMSKSTIAQVQTDLELVVQSKAEQIYRWRAERIADGEVLTTNYNLTAAIDRFIKNPQALEDKKLIQSRIDNYIKVKKYRDVILVDTLGNIRLPENSSLKRLDRDCITSLNKSLSASKTMMGDINSNTTESEICVDVVSPIYINPAVRDKAVGALVFWNTPGDFIYPMLESITLPGKSTETLIFRQDDSEVQYLSELKYVSETPLSFRLPLSTPGLVDAKAIRGNVGNLRGVDYRNVKVIASIIPVKDSPWFIEAKVDEKEALAAIKTRTTLIFCMTLLSQLVVLALFGWVFAKRQSLFLTGQIKAQSEQQNLLKHFEYLFKYANDIILLKDEDDNIIEVNSKAEKVYGYTHTEFLSLKYSGLKAPNTDDEFSHSLTPRKHKEGVIYESKHISKQGKIYEVEISSRLIHMDEKIFYLRIIRDITERKNAENIILHQSRLYIILNHINQAVMRVQDKQTLYLEACRIAVEDGKLPLAVIVSLDESTSMITPTAYFGAYGGYLSNARMSVLDEPAGKGPIANAVTYDKVFVVNDIETDPGVELWRDEAIRRGFFGNAIFPIHFDKKVIGAFLVYAREKGYFSDSLVSLYTTVAMDISSGLEFISNRKKIEQSETILRSFFDSSSERFIMLDSELKIITCNKVADDFIFARFGKHLKAGEYMGDYFPPDKKEVNRKELDLALSGVSSVTVRQLDVEGKTGYYEFRYDPVYVDKHINGVSVTIDDITEKKQNDLAEQRHLLELESKVLERTQQLLNANSELESFSYSVSHDLRTPLRTIDGFAKALEEDFGSLINQQAADYLLRIRNAISHMSQLIEDILNLSRVTSQIVSWEKVNLSNIVNSRLHEYKTENPKRKIITRVEEKLTVDGDSKLLTIALHNLIDNCIKFTGCKAETVIEFGKDIINGEPVYYLRDNGEGFEMKYVDKLFTPFQRLHAKDKYPGTGVGLSVVKRIITKHNGNVRIESHPEEGTTVFIKL